MRNCQCAACQLKKQQMENDMKSMPEIHISKNDIKKIKRYFKKILNEVHDPEGN